jgi:hypothetical protein
LIALLDGLELAYDDGGSGTPCLFIHGFPHDRSLWAPQLQGLTVNVRCLAPDLRGFGETTVSPPYSMDRYADDMAALLDVLHVERAVIAGLSMGGYVATVSAFSAVNMDMIRPMWLQWLWPTIVGTPLIVLWVRHYKQKLASGRRLRNDLDIRIEGASVQRRSERKRSRSSRGR